MGDNLLDSRKRKFPGDTQAAFAKRIGVGRATLQRMEAGDLSVSMDKYFAAATVLGLEFKFDDLLKTDVSLFDE
ncbi:helix-turn-helix domain-containing protein [Parahaliea mediterranea]|uniref:Helix-turn-helix transcriptional regulator n=1 Tax=Parahaliea mediterranea TaxID=651086 RepID=A0A939DFB2_9GAMM|nr:helix-turn-helix transcriptional regulator [Parahaliea mediterranea]MBN7797151.1 helix-turn-helix transcriptional regulator [Parahaliea mediterranea]